MTLSKFPIFIGDSLGNEASVVEEEKTTGAYLFVIINTDITITNCRFANGISSTGGAIYSSGRKLNLNLIT